jgi:predicted DCC family thiol-disulfide oxidoreductase YuxK
MDGVPSPTLVFDGDCAFCTTAVGVARRVLPAEVTVVAWQFADLDALGTTADRAQQEVLWVDADGTVSGGAVAVARLLRAAGLPLSVLGVLISLPPLRWLAPPVYRLVAANRHRLPGGTPACRVTPRDGV